MRRQEIFEISVGCHVANSYTSGFTVRNNTFVRSILLFTPRIAVSHLRAGRGKKGGICMAREKANYRETLQFLTENGYPLLMQKKDVAEKLGISRPTLDKLIKKGSIKTEAGQIPIGSLASYLCG